MNFRTTIILLVLLVAAAAFVLISVRSEGEGEESAKKATPKAGEAAKLIDLPTDDVSKIVLRPATGAAIELVKNGTDWRMQQPLQWAANRFESRNLAEAFTDAKVSGSADITDQNRAGMGFDKPQATVDLVDKDGKTHTLTIGTRSLGRLYVRTSDQPNTAFLISSGSLSEKLSKPTDELVSSLRDKKLVSLDSFNVKQVTIDRDGKTLRLSKENNVWELYPPAGPSESPARLEADSSEVSDLVTTLTTLQADEFGSEGGLSSAAGLERPRAIVKLSTAAPATEPATQPATGQTVTIAVGSPADLEGTKYWVRIDNPAAVAKASLTKINADKVLQASAWTLRDRKIVDLDPAQVSEVTIKKDGGPATQPSEPMTLSRRKETRELGPVLPKTGPDSQPASPPATQPASQPSAFVPAEARPAGVRPALARLSLAHIGIPLLSTVLLQADAAPAAASPATQPSSIASDSPATRPAAEPSPAATQPVATQPVALIGSTRPIALPMEPPAPPPAQWTISSKGDKEANDASVTSFLSDLHPLKATKFLEKMPSPPAAQPASNPSAPATAPATRPTPVVYTVVIKTVAAGGDSHTVEFKVTDFGGDAKPVGEYGGLIFEVAPEFLQKLKGDFVSAPAAPAAPPMQPPMNFPGGGL